LITKVTFVTQYVFVTIRVVKEPPGSITVNTTAHQSILCWASSINSTVSSYLYWFVTLVLLLS